VGYPNRRRITIASAGILGLVARWWAFQKDRVLVVRGYQIELRVPVQVTDRDRLGLSLVALGPEEPAAVAYMAARHWT
jgi:hypothetical protein